MLKKLEKKTRWDWEQKARDNAEKVIVTPMNDAGLWSIIYADGSVYSEYHNPNMYYVEPSLESIATYYYQAREVDTCIDSDSDVANASTSTV